MMCQGQSDFEKMRGRQAREPLQTYGWYNSILEAYIGMATTKAKGDGQLLAQKAWDSVRRHGAG